jgi:hypothetical protein
MKLYDFYFYYYLAPKMVSTYSSLVTASPDNLPEINILVYLLPQPLIFLLLVFQSQTKTHLKCIPAVLKGIRQPLRNSKISVCTS